MDGDDWRVSISFADRLQAARAKARYKVADYARRRLGTSIAMGAGGAQVFLYAGSETAAREAERIAREVLAGHHFQAELAIDRWHPAEQAWEDPDVPMPRTDAERRAEHERLMAEETAESSAAGAAQWQVRAELPSHQEAVALAARLRDEGRPVIRRWTFLVVPGQQRRRGAWAGRPDPPGSTSRRDGARRARPGRCAVHGLVSAPGRRRRCAG